MSEIASSSEKSFQIIVIPVTPLAQNCTVLICRQTSQAAIIDPGGDAEAILATVRESGADIGKILLTHGHFDHAGAAAELRDRLGVPIEGPHRGDRILLANLALQAKVMGLEELRNVTPDRWLDDGDTVAVGGMELDVRHCPGHTPGHVIFANMIHKFAIVGDVLFSGSIGRTDFPYGDHAALLAAIRDKLLPLGDDFTFLCGHGPGGSLGWERRHNPHLRGLA